MNKTQNPKSYDLGERTKKFAKKVRDYVKNLPKTLANIEDGKQLIRSSGSVGSNYIEAEEALSKKDFMMRIKICRKEALISNIFFAASELNSSSSTAFFNFSKKSLISVYFNVHPRPAFQSHRISALHECRYKLFFYYTY